jgi:spore maturation protein CgeB
MPVLRLEIARDGNPVPVLDGITLHSRYEPNAEGVKLAAAAGEGGDRIAVFGAGFGYHIRPLLQRFGVVYVHEPTYELGEIVHSHPACADWVGAVTWLARPEDVPSGTPVFALPPVRRLFPEVFARFQSVANAPQDNGNEFPFSQLRVLLDYPVYGGSHTTAKYMENALQELGCRVETMDNAFAEPVLQHILAVKDPNHSGPMAGRLTDLLSELLREKIRNFRPHVLICPAQSPVTIPLLRSLKDSIATAFWFVEDYRRFAYWRDYAREFDLFAGIQRDKFDAELRLAGCPDPLYLPMAADETVQRPLELPPEERRFFGSDIAFMGAGYPNRHKLLAELTDYDLKIWGVGWEGNPRLAAHVANQGRRVSIDETVKIYNAARINLNLHSSMESDYFEADGDFLNPRTFEIMACGGFQLTDRRSLLAELFEEGREIEVFSSLAELRQKIDYYLAHPEERRRIAENGRRRVLRDHTYKLRMVRLLTETLIRRPDLAQKAQAESRRGKEARERIADPGLERFLESVPEESRDSLPDLVEAVKRNSGTLTRHEAIILALGTFAGED